MRNRQIFCRAPGKKVPSPCVAAQLSSCSWLPCLPSPLFRQWRSGCNACNHALSSLRVLRTISGCAREFRRVLGASSSASMHRLKSSPRHAFRRWPNGGWPLRPRFGSAGRTSSACVPACRPEWVGVWHASSGTSTASLEGATRRFLPTDLGRASETICSRPRLPGNADSRFRSRR